MYFSSQLYTGRFRLWIIKHNSHEEKIPHKMYSPPFIHSPSGELILGSGALCLQATLSLVLTLCLVEISRGWGEEKEGRGRERERSAPSPTLLSILLSATSSCGHTLPAGACSCSQTTLSSTLDTASAQLIGLVLSPRAPFPLVRPRCLPHFLLPSSSHGRAF